MLVNVYFGMFKVREVNKIKNSMTELFLIFLDRIAPTSLAFNLREHDDEVTLTITDSIQIEVTEQSSTEPVPHQQENDNEKEKEKRKTQRFT